MRYERTKELAAVLSVLSVVATLAVTSDILGVIPRQKILLVTVGAAASAAVAAVLSLFWSRRLQLKREKRRVFLIYSRADLEPARRLAHELRQRGFRPWLDVDEITPGQVWRKAVLRGLEESVAALVLVSPNLERPGFVHEELKAALETLQETEENVSPVIPVRMADVTVPPQLAHINWVDLFEPDGMDRLEAGLSRMVPAPERRLTSA